MGILDTNRQGHPSARIRQILLTAVSIALLFLAMAPSIALGQVISINVGVEEIYDDNIFLEDERPIPADLLQNLPDDVVDKIITNDNDGDPNSSFITHPYISFEGALPKTTKLSQYTEITGKVGFGAFIFHSESDENRLSLDSLLSAKTTETLLGKPWRAGVSSQFLSGSRDISVAQGSAGEQIQTHDATLGFGVEGWQVADKTEAAIGYELIRHDFLGDFVLDSRDDDSTREANGADYFSNGLNADVTRHLTDKLSLELTSGVRYMDFTKVESNDPLDPAGEDLDRTEYDIGGGFTYVVSDKVQLSALAGLNVSSFADTPIKNTAVINPETGAVEERTEPGDDTLTSLFYNGGIDYAPAAGTTLNLAVSQSQETDVDGTVVLVRTVSLNAAQNLGERFKVIGSGRYVQFEEGDSLSDATDRWELLGQVRYQLAEAAALSVGYSYITQNVDELGESLNFSNADYDVNRAFIRLDFGLAGITT